jgi:hypothetical protein
LSSAQKSEVNEKVCGLRHRASPASSFTQLRSTNLAPCRHTNATRKRHHNTHTMEKYYGKDRLSAHEPQFVDCKSLTVAISRNIIIRLTDIKRSDTKGKVFSPLSSAQKSEVNEKVYGFRHCASPASSFTQLRSTNLAPVATQTQHENVTTARTQ